MAYDICDCNLTDVVPNITEQPCSESYGQPGKVAFGTIGNKFSDATDYDTESSWQTRIASVTATKIQVTRKIETFTQTGGDPIPFGGNDNTTFDGAPIMTGKNSTEFVFSFYNMPEVTRQELKAYFCQSETRTLGMYLIGDNWSWSKTDYDLIPISTVSISDPILGGRTSPIITNMTITLPYNWDDNLLVTKHANFNPMTLTN